MDVLQTITKFKENCYAQERLLLMDLYYTQLKHGKTHKEAIEYAFTIRNLENTAIFE